MARVPEALASLERALREGMARRDRRRRRARRSRCAEQAATWGGDRHRPVLRALVDGTTAKLGNRGFARARRTPPRPRPRRTRGSRRSSREEYAPKRRPARSGRARALRARSRAASTASSSTSTRPTQWGWEELYRIEHAMREVGERILPGEPLDEVIEHLDRDPHARSRASTSSGAGTRTSSTARSPSSTARTSTSPSRSSACEAMIAPPGGAAAMYYTGPSEDFSRPGRTWYPTLGKTRSRCGAR